MCKFGISVVLLGAAHAALAQDAQRPTFPAPPDPASAPSPGRNPSVSSLMQTFGIPEAEAVKRIDLQAEVIKLTNAIQKRDEGPFASVFIQHEPTYKVVVSFADNQARRSFYRRSRLRFVKS
jgi:hypothetical protein